MIFYSNFAGVVQILFITFFTGELQSATQLCMENGYCFAILLVCIFSIWHYHKKDDSLSCHFLVGSIYGLCGRIFLFHNCKKVWGSGSYLCGMHAQSIDTYVHLPSPPSFFIYLNNKLSSHSVVLSFLLFPKPFTWMYVFSAGMFFLGFGLNAFSSHRVWIVQTFQAYLEKRKGIDHREW